MDTLRFSYDQTEQMAKFYEVGQTQTEQTQNVQTQAVQWWGEALKRYMRMYRSVSAKEMHFLGLPEISDGQIKGFSDALQQQLDEALKAVDYNHPTLLFVNDKAVSKELSQASQQVGIETVQRILPEDIVMRVYPDEVLVTLGDQSSAKDVTIIQSTQPHLPQLAGAHLSEAQPDYAEKTQVQENTAVVSAIQELAHFLGMSVSVLQQMSEDKNLIFSEEESGICFRCQGIEGIISHGTLQEYSKRQCVRNENENQICRF